MSDDEQPPDPLGAIRRAFAEMFAGVGAELPDQLDERGSFVAGDWGFRYAVNECDGVPCVDVVAQAGASDQLERFLASGEVESGPNIVEMVILDPDTDDDFESASRRVAEHNRHVGDVMRARGLL